MRCFVEGAGLLAPGLSGWQHARSILSGKSEYRAGDFVIPKPAALPPVERRRTGTPVNLAIAAGQDALLQTGLSAADIATVFASSDSDGDVIDDICRTLAGSDRLISPTRFHNSVHNAPAGYWSIATGSNAASTSICAMEWSAAAGLVEAASQIATGHERVMLITYDVPYPQPLLGARPTTHAFGSALILSREHTANSHALLQLTILRTRAISRMEHPALENIRVGNSAARILPLLAAVAKSGSHQVALEYISGNTLGIDVDAC